MTVRLVIGAAAYVLAQRRGDEWAELSTLPGGASALLPPGREADEGALELAIEVPEDWLMPHARFLQGQELEVADVTGRLAAGLTAVLEVSEREWTLEAVEEMFLHLVDIATGLHRQLPDGQQLFVADVLLIRELTHHGRVRGVRLVSDVRARPG